MYKKHSQFYYCPSDIWKVRSQSWMDRFSIERPDDVPQRDLADALMASYSER